MGAGDKLTARLSAKGWGGRKSSYTVKLNGLKPLQSPVEFVKYQSFTGAAFHYFLTNG
jgi:hypothetical protein